MSKSFVAVVCFVSAQVVAVTQPAFTNSVSGEIQGIPEAQAGYLRVELYDLAQHVRMAAATVAANGSFELLHVAPGEYDLRVVDQNGTCLMTQIVPVANSRPGLSLRLPTRYQTAAPAGGISLSRLQHRVPKDALKAFRRAARMVNDGKREAAIPLLEMAVREDPQFFEARLYLGTAHFVKQEWAEANQEFAEAAKLDPSSVTALTNLAATQWELHDLPGAERSAQIALRLDPTSVRANYCLGLTWAAEHRYGDETLAHLTLAHPQYPHSRIVAAEVLVALGRVDEARTELRSYLQNKRVANRDWVVSLLAQLEDR